MRIERLVLGPLETNCWLVGDEAATAVLVIDPADDAAAVLDAVDRRPVAAVVLTHCHFDHLGAVREVCAATGAPLLVHEDDADFVTSVEGTGGALFGFDDTTQPVDVRLRQGDAVHAGDVALTVLHTPGHTPGSMCLYAPGHLFAGDTVFAGSVGRTDFPRGDGRALARSIADEIAPLPDDTAVHPGHGPDTTIARERRINPFFPRG